MATDKDVSDVAHKIAVHWHRDRIHYAAELRKLPQQIQSLLDDLEKMTRGDDRRCFCLSRSSGHDMQCPARKR